MADNTVVSPSGDTIRDIDRSGVKTQVMQLDIGGAAGESLASASNPVPIALTTTPFVPNAGNTSSANLAPGQSFVGTISANLNQPSISLNLTSDQPMLFKLRQSPDAAGVNALPDIIVPVTFDVRTQRYSASVCVIANSNFWWTDVLHVGGATTTVFTLDCGTGWLWPNTTLGNLPTSINEIGGTLLTAGAKPAAQSVPVALATDQLQAGLNVTSAQLAELLAPAQAGTDAPSLSDLLNPMSEAYVPPRIQLLDQGGSPVNFNNGNMPVASATRVVNGSIYAANHSTQPVYCGDMNSASLAAIYAVSATTLPEGYFPGLGWLPLFAQALSGAGGTGFALSANLTTAAANLVTNSIVNLAGAEWFRVRATSLGALGFVRVYGQLNQTATMPYAVNVNSNTGTLTVQPGNTPNTVPWLTTPGNPTAFSLNSAATTNATSVKASAGNLHGVSLTNNGAAVCFFKLYNKASAPTVGTDTPLLVVSIPANGIPVLLNWGDLGFRFSTGIAYALTNLIADADATAVAAGQVKLMGSYV